MADLMLLRHALRRLFFGDYTYQIYR